MEALVESIKLVFSKTLYVSIAVLTATVVFTAAVWLSNFALITQVATSNSASLSEKVSFMTSLYGSIQTNFTAISASYTVLIAILFGISISMFVYYLRRQQGLIQSSASATSLAGLVSGFFGIGCAACGTFILTSVLGLIGAGGILTYLPLGGEEFGLLGVGLLGYSIYKTSQLIQKPLVCVIE